jgi:hypothetical protein
MISFKNPDFSQLVSAIQSVVQGFTELQKVSSSKLETGLSGTINQLQGASGDGRENTHFASKTKPLLQDSPSPRPPLGASLIYGTRSSHLLRLIPVLYAIKNRCAVVFLCSTSQHELYEKLLDNFLQNGIPEKSFALISTHDPEILETLIAHPSLKTIHFNGHFYEGAFLKTIPLPIFKKRIRIQLGGRNPVIFTHDAPFDSLKDILEVALNTTYLAEHTFNRWFVQDKIYPDFIKAVEGHLTNRVLHKEHGNDMQYMHAVELQNQSLLREKNWIREPILFNPDFNNCSPWQQQEVLDSLLTITRYKTTSEAIKFANTTNYASGAAVFSGHLEKSMEIANQLNMPHRFPQIVPDMGVLATISGLTETGVGQQFSDHDFFVF